MKKATLLSVALVMVSVSLAFAAGQDEQAATEGPVELDVFLVQNPGISSVTDNLERELLEEMFNVEFDLVVATAESMAEKQQLLLASGGYPSVFFYGEDFQSGPDEVREAGCPDSSQSAYRKVGPEHPNRFREDAYTRPGNHNTRWKYLQSARRPGVLSLHILAEAVDQHRVAQKARFGDAHEHG
jgi:hypothetical protein